MRVWTTSQIGELLVGNGFPTSLHPDNRVREAFLEGAAHGDCAVVPFDENYRDFLTAVKKKGTAGPVVFIAREATIAPETVPNTNAAVLDVKKLGPAELKRLVHFILTIALERPPAQFPHLTLDSGETCTADEAPQPAGVNVNDVLTALIKEGASVGLSIPVKEEGEQVRVRGICALKQLTDDTLFITRFKPQPLLHSLKPGTDLTLLLSRDGKQYHATAAVIGVGAEGLSLAVPEQLFIMKRRFLRIEPSPKKPIHCYFLVPGRPTVHAKAVEISQRGVGFASVEGIERGKSYAATLVLPDPPAVIVCTALIRCKNENESGFRYGAELRMHARDEELIARYIMQREIELIGMLREMES